MTYEIAKKLKDAGYSQEDPRRTPVTITNENVHEFLMKVKGDCYIPSLSELIEACGDVFDSLEKRGNVYFAFGSSKDKAMMKIDPYRGGGATPEEAVANLFLRLNEKK